ncbi:hypothetical protein IT409_01160 [Candidatus Falkowbacteria bacterium]|nr:hypothetical protein [Candidatus Falkowbacteria bacterium]
MSKEIEKYHHMREERYAHVRKWFYLFITVMSLIVGTGNTPREIALIAIITSHISLVTAQAFFLAQEYHKSKLRLIALYESYYNKHGVDIAPQIQIAASKLIRR